MIRDGQGGRITPLKAAKLIFCALGSQALDMPIKEIAAMGIIGLDNLTPKEGEQVLGHLRKIRSRVYRLLNVVSPKIHLPKTTKEKIYSLERRIEALQDQKAKLNYSLYRLKRVSEKFPDPQKRASMFEARLTSRTKSVLRNNLAEVIEDPGLLLKRRPSDLLTIKGLGRKAILEITLALVEFEYIPHSRKWSDI